MNYNNPLERIKKQIEEEYGDVGLKIYQKSILKLKIDEKPSRMELETLISDISETFVKLYGKNKSREIFSNLQNELFQEDRTFESRLVDKLDYFFMTNGIPRESDIIDISNNLLANGYGLEEDKLVEKLKTLSKERVISALNQSIINRHVKGFLDKYKTYTQSDINDFIQFLKFKKLIINVKELKDSIEKERLFRKFNEVEPEETLEDQISRAYIALYNSSNDPLEDRKITNHYGYLLNPGDSLVKFIKNIEIN